MKYLESRPLAVVAMLLLAAVSAVLVPGFRDISAAATKPVAEPKYTQTGALLLPEDFRSWVFVGASTGLSYSSTREGRSGPGMFHNVYITPRSYEHFAGTGEFPERTMLALAMYEPSQKDGLVRGGFFEGEFIGLEIAVKDSARFEVGWAYFDFGGRNGLRGEAQPITGGCASCHRQHGAVDNVFVQFYPVLRSQLEARPAAR